MKKKTIQEFMEWLHGQLLESSKKSASISKSIEVASDAGQDFSALVAELKKAHAEQEKIHNAYDMAKLALSQS